MQSRQVDCRYGFLYEPTVCEKNGRSSHVRVAYLWNFDINFWTYIVLTSLFYKLHLHYTNFISLKHAWDSALSYQSFVQLLCDVLLEDTDLRVEEGFWLLRQQNVGNKRW